MKRLLVKLMLDWWNNSF